MERIIRASVMCLFCLVSFGERPALSADSRICDDVTSVTVHPEEYVDDTSLTDLMSRLIANGRRLAVEQVTTTRVLSKSSERIRNDDISFKSDTSQRFRGTVTSHEILERTPGQIGNRETLRITMRVNVCVTPADQVWYVRIEEVRSETHGIIEWMQSRFHSPTDRIQLVRPGELRADEAAYKLLGQVFSENISVRNHTNINEVEAYKDCVQKKKQRAQTRNQQNQHYQSPGQQKGSLEQGLAGLAILGIVAALVSDADSCGDPPQLVTGEKFEAKAIFQIKICDTHSGDCRSFRQPYESQGLVKTANDKQVAHREFFHEGFGLVGAIALHDLQGRLGMLAK